MGLAFEQIFKGAGFFAKHGDRRFYLFDGQ